MHGFQGAAAVLVALGVLAAAATADPLEAGSSNAAPGAPLTLEIPPDPAGGPFAESPIAPNPPLPPPSLIEQAWEAPASDLSSRVVRTRRVALELGAWNLDPAARALVGGPTQSVSLERATAAVELAPDLPAVRMRLAQALWLKGGAPISAIRAVLGGLAAVARHPEASVWFGGSALYVLAVSLVGGGLLCILLAGLVGLRHAAHDLGHLISRSTPEFARCAGLAALLLVPVALGEGVMGLALGLVVVAVVYAGRSWLPAMGLAIAAIGIGAYPVAQFAGAALAAFPGDPVARAAYSVAHGIGTPVDVARLEAAADQDSLAARGLAIQARRTGNLGEADALYQRLLEDFPNDLAVLNNAANVRLDLGHMERALELYRHAVELEESPVVLFNLAQAYGRAFQVENLNRTLAHAQEVGGEFVAELTALQGTEAEGFVVDFPLRPALLWSRAIHRRAGDPIAAELRAFFAPGRLGTDPRWFVATAAAALLLAGILGSQVPTSRSCARCGSRICPRCSSENAGGELCESCNRLFFQPEKTDRVLRLERMNELRHRERRLSRLTAAASVLVPGAAGLVARRPIRSLVGSVCFALAVAAALWRQGVVPDPLVAGIAAPIAFLGMAALATLGYAAAVGTSLAARDEG